jgi:hypothetical protein
MVGLAPCARLSQVETPIVTPRLLAALLLPASAFAQSTVETKLAALEAATKSAQSAGDNAWMLVSAALVLMMTSPGLTLFYGGLVRKKNVIATMMQSFVLMALVTVLWGVVGYSLAFGEGMPFLGDLRYAFLNGVGSAPNPDYAGTIPQQTYMIYQLMFAIITPALITGAFAERMKFSAMLLFMTLWIFVVYFPMAHMVWGKGGLLNAYLGGRIPCFDFAGGTVVHITSGVSALVRTLPRQTGRIPDRFFQASQPRAQFHRRKFALGWVVRIQRRQRSGRLKPGYQRFCRHAFRRGGCDARLVDRRVDDQRQAERSRRDLRSRGRVGRHHSRLRLRQADAGAGHWLYRRRRLLPYGHRGETEIRL